MGSGGGITPGCFGCSLLGPISYSQHALFISYFKEPLLTLQEPLDEKQWPFLLQWAKRRIAATSVIL